MIPERFPFHPDQIPGVLKGPRAWVCCDGAKVPMIPGTRRRASATDPATWRPYETARRSLESCPNLHAGLGRVIRHGEGLVGVDLDGVRDPETGKITDAAREILEALDSYSEVSPSGRGVKVWARARLDRSHVKPGLEVYNGRRYFVVTGEFLPQYPPAVMERQSELEELVKREFLAWKIERRGGHYHGPWVALEEYLRIPGVEVLEEVPDSLGAKFRIRCPWREEHSDGDESGTYIGQRSDGGLWFVCHHAHCSSRGWREFRSLVAGGRGPRSRRRVVIRLD